MPTDSCDRCRDSVSTALLRDIELRVDGAEVDAQAVCPDCFADWIGQYQERLAADGAGLAEEPSVGAGRADPPTESVSAARDRGDNEIREVGRLAGSEGGEPAADGDDPEDDGRSQLR
ncbi:MAG: DUF7569 family protein [Halolamina sp.]